MTCREVESLKYRRIAVRKSIIRKINRKSKIIPMLLSKIWPIQRKRCLDHSMATPSRVPTPRTQDTFSPHWA
jgi:hypothetical protein